ncbi:MAG: O-antigen ligase family protein [Desulfuromonadaceae bacterium]
MIGALGEKINAHGLRMLLLPMSCYLLSFFLPVDSRLNNNIFYVFVLIPFVLCIEKRDIFKYLASSTIFKLSIAFSLYLVARSAFYFDTNVILYFEPARHFISWAVFMAVSAGLLLRSSLLNSIKLLSIWASLWGAGNLIYFYWDHDLSTRLIYNGPVYHEILGASVYAFLCVLAATIAMRPQHESFGMYFVAIALLVCVFMSQSRGVILAVLVSIFFAIPFARIKIVAPLIAASVLAFSIAFSLFSENLARITQLTTSYRIDIWSQVLKDSLAEGTWLFGNSLLASHEISVGSATFNHMHSGYFGTYFYGGLVGFMMLLMLILGIGCKVYALGKENKDPMPIGLFVFMVFIISTDNHLLLDGPSEIWFYFWLPASILIAKELQNKHVKQSRS